MKYNVRVHATRENTPRFVKSISARKDYMNGPAAIKSEKVEGKRLNINFFVNSLFKFTNNETLFGGKAVR